MLVAVFVVAVAYADVGLVPVSSAGDGGGAVFGTAAELVVLFAEGLEVVALLVVVCVVAAVGTAAPATGDDKGARALEFDFFVLFVLFLAVVVVVGGVGESSLPTELRPGAEFGFEEEFAVFLLAHEEEFAVVDVAEVFEVFDGEVVPFHEEDAGHEAVGDWWWFVC